MGPGVDTISPSLAKVSSHTERMRGCCDFKKKSIVEGLLWPVFCDGAQMQKCSTYFYWISGCCSLCHISPGASRWWRLWIMKLSGPTNRWHFLKVIMHPPPQNPLLLSMALIMDFLRFGSWTILSHLLWVRWQGTFYLKSPETGFPNMLPISLYLRPITVWWVTPSHFMSWPLIPTLNKLSEITQLNVYAVKCPGIQFDTWKTP